MLLIIFSPLKNFAIPQAFQNMECTQELLQAKVLKENIFFNVNSVHFGTIAKEDEDLG